MRTHGYQNYFDDEVLNANPVQLVQMMYRGALDSIASARRYLRLGNILSRSRAIGKALAIVIELSRSLDAERGGELSRSLAELYDYIQRLLVQANVEQRSQPLEEAERLLSTLAQAWGAVDPHSRTSNPSEPKVPADREYYQPISCAY